MVTLDSNGWINSNFQLAERGLNIVLVSLLLEELEAVAKEIGKQRKLQKQQILLHDFYRTSRGNLQSSNQNYRRGLYQRKRNFQKN